MRWMKPVSYRTLTAVSLAVLLRGEADLHMQPLELMPVPGITIAGTLPAELNATSDIAAAVLTKALSPDKTLAFAQYLAKPETAATHKQKNVEPPLQSGVAASSQ
jgi:molybdate transport system substrate-binding protein